MTKLLTFGSRILFTAIAFVCATFVCSGDDSAAANSGERSQLKAAVESNPGGTRCDDYPIALEPNPNAQAQAEQELQGLAPGAPMIWHPARGTFWFVTLGVPLPQCGPQDEVFTQLFALTRAYPGLFQLDLTEWQAPASYPCANVGQVAQVLQIQRARVGSHPITQDLMRFTVQRVNGIVMLQALFGEYLPPATPLLDQSLSACPNLDNGLARQVVLDSLFSYSIFDSCFYIGSAEYSPNGLDKIAFAARATWSWDEDPTAPRVLFTKSNQGRLVLDSGNYTPELLASDANCPNEAGQPKIGFRLTFDTVMTNLVGYQPGLNCVVCLR